MSDERLKLAMAAAAAARVCECVRESVHANGYLAGRRGQLKAVAVLGRVLVGVHASHSETSGGDVDRADGLHVRRRGVVGQHTIADLEPAQLPVRDAGELLLALPHVAALGRRRGRIDLVAVDTLLGRLRCRERIALGIRLGELGRQCGGYCIIHTYTHARESQLESLASADNNDKEAEKQSSRDAALEPMWLRTFSRFQ